MELEKIGQLFKHNGPILNSKLEWHQPKIIGNVIIQGGAEAVRGNMGLKPNSSPPPNHQLC